MTFKELQGIMDKITYKPGIKISVWRRSHVDHIEFTVSALLPDATSFENLVSVKSCGILFEEALKTMTAEHLLHFIKTCLISFERHEIDEWLKIDGIHVTEPHPELTTHSS